MTYNELSRLSASDARVQSAIDAEQAIDAAKLRPLYWTLQDAGGDVDARQYIHGLPLNVFCGKCEA